MELKPASFV